MSRTHTHFNSRNTGERFDTTTGRRQHLAPRPIPTVRHPDRYSLLWFGRIALVWAAASAVAGFGLAFWGRS